MTNAWLIASLILASLDAYEASFDCRKASKPVEKMICADAALSDLDARLAEAYRQALSISPRPDSLQLDQRRWLSDERSKCADVACLKGAYGRRLAALEAEKGVSPSFDKAPFLNPRIVEDLSTDLPDQGDQVIAIDVADSQSSNRYSVDVETRTNRGTKPYVFYRTKLEGDAEASFGYRLVGTTTTGVDVLVTYESGGGSGVFTNLLLVTIRQEASGMFPRVFSGNDQSVTFKRKRLVIKRLGEIGLGDRWNGDLAIVGNEIRIGKDKGILSDRSPLKGRVITVDYQP